MRPNVSLSLNEDYANAMDATTQTNLRCMESCIAINANNEGSNQRRNSTTRENGKTHRDTGGTCQISTKRRDEPDYDLIKRVALVKSRNEISWKRR